MSSTNRHRSGDAPVPPKRGRGRPRRVRQLHIEPIRRSRLDYYKLTRALFGLAIANRGEPLPPHATGQGGAVRPPAPDSGATGAPGDPPATGQPSAATGGHGQRGLVATKAKMTAIHEHGEQHGNT